ncbi:lytic transglycosylase domain-containing protein [Bradyrhizobium iriomotense]|uniref:Transglycosylase n=1 Tax=Bradyrhizobium iriomotense TaxID=441950 RepID=A0ABQ6B7J2_9BRAD|nr:lytic transglycosylase domain-containing protein [Bradyrhizobium iriomotense]GLR88900.1 transglycosylase [Bradyrhizobium iriomotense]
MRFVFAALAAFLVLMLDLDGPATPASSVNNLLLAASPSEHISSAFAALFESAKADEQSNATPAQESSSPSDRPAETITEYEAEQSPHDAFCHALREAAENSEIPVPFFARLIWQESRFRSNEVSHAGARGVAQFMPETAAEVGLDDPLDPFKALPASAKLLRKLRDDFGNLGLAAAAYNAGSGRIQKWLAKQSALPRETRDYVHIITGTKAEDWIEDADMLAIRIDLPSEAPCEGVGGLSKIKEVAFVSASPAASVTALIQKAQSAEATAKLAAHRVRKRLALLLKRSAPSTGATRLGRARSMIAPRAARNTKTRGIRIASRVRSSS